MSTTAIESKLIRKGGSRVDIGGTEYHFQPYTDGAHVCEVANEAHADRFLSITEGYRLYRGKGTPADGNAANPAGAVPDANVGADAHAPHPMAAPAASPEILLGGDFPASFDIHGATYSLGDIVARAHTESGLSVADWNNLPEDERDGKIEAELDRIDAAGQDTAAEAGERDVLVAQYTSLYGEAPHGRTGIKKLRELIAAKL